MTINGSVAAADVPATTGGIVKTEVGKDNGSGESYTLRL